MTLLYWSAVRPPVDSKRWRDWLVANSAGTVPRRSNSNRVYHNAGMTTLLAALIGGGLAIAGGLLGVFATDRRERNRWRRDAAWLKGAATKGRGE